MRWPLVSRTAFDAVCSERDFLREQVSHLRRLERVEAGLSETPAPAKKLLPPMPDEVRGWINSHDGDKMRDRLRKEAFAAAREAGSWAPVVARLTREGE